MYKLTQSEKTVQRLSDNAFIPFDGGNRDYQEYLEWLAEGNTPESYVPPPAPPVTQVTAYQAKIQLSRAGLYDSVVTTVNTSDNPELKIAWEVATTFERNSPFILALQPELGLTDAQVDDLFQQASQIS
jgi:DNA-binding XRE family transcriptional regulator